MYVSFLPLFALTIIHLPSHLHQVEAYTAKVINGTAANIGEFPWIARINVSQESGNEILGTLCTGTLIRPDFLLTAAHCVIAEYKIIGIKAHMGGVTVGDEPQVRQYKRLYSHPCYRPHGPSLDRYDIALLELNAPFMVNHHVKTIDLAEPTQNLEEWDGFEVVVVGWGYDAMIYDKDTKKWVQHDTAHLKYAKEWVVSLKEWDLSESWKWAFLVVLGNKTTMCLGDSGGPLLLWRDGHYFVIGTASAIYFDKHGQYCIDDETPQYYIRLDKHWHWISSVLKDRNYFAVDCNHEDYFFNQNGTTENDVLLTTSNQEIAHKQINSMVNVLLIYCVSLFG